MDARVRNVGHPMPKIAGFTAKQRSAFRRGDRRGNPARKSWRVEKNRPTDRTDDACSDRACDGYGKTPMRTFLDSLEL
jgi:hypothetical protein